MHLSTTGFNAFLGFGNCPWRHLGRPFNKIIPVWWRGKNEATDNFLEFLSRIHFLAFFFVYSKKRVMCFWMVKTGDLATRTPSAIVPPVIASSERAFATSGSQGWAREIDGRYPKLPRIMVQWKMGCIWNIVVSFQLGAHFPLNHDHGRKGNSYF